MKDTCASRLKKGLEIRNMKQSELCRITKIPKSAISQYISGSFEPKQDRVFLIASALNVSEAWLMGFDVPMGRTPENNVIEKIQAAQMSDLSDDDFRIIELYLSLSPEKRGQALDYLRFLAETSNK